jgi:hypothetical protein
VIRNDSGKRQNKCGWIFVGPGYRGKKPINLLQQRNLLHIAPGIASTLDWEFNKPKMTNDTIEH